MTKRGKSFVNLSDAAFVYEHTLQWSGFKLILEPFTLAQEQVIDVQSAVMKGFIIALSLGNDEISSFKHFTGFGTDMGKPGTANIISVSDHAGYLSKSDIAGILKGCIINRRKTSDNHRDVKLWIEFFKKLDMADYAKKSFGMFGGKEQTVKLLVKNNLAGVIIDRFGKNAILFPTDDEYFTVNVEVHVSRQFLGWVFSLGDGIKIVGPDDVVEEMRMEVTRLIQQYD